MTAINSKYGVDYGSINSDYESGNSCHENKNKGHKGTLGFLGIIAIVVNSLTGPAMLNLPNTYQKSGLIPTTSAIIFLCILSNFCSLHIANVISKVPGNENFQQEIEYSQVFRVFGGKRAFYLTQSAFFLCITCLLIASIVDTAQVLDQIFAHRPQGVSALRIIDGSIDIISWNSNECLEKEIDMGECIPFFNEKDGALIFSVGYLVAAIPFLPMSLMDLKENTVFQIAGFFVLLIVSLQFIVTFLIDGIDISNVSWWGNDWGNLFGVVLFNFAAVLSVPAWLYERDTAVDVRKAINVSSMIGVVLYILVGGLGALTMPHVSSNMLLFMMSGAYGPITEICSEIFAFFIIGFGIPLFSVLLRLNLVGCGLCNERQANVFAVYLPWMISWLFYSGESTTILLGWGGIFFTSIIAFLAPLLLSLYTRIYSDVEGSIDVYGGTFRSKKEQVIMLSVLLLLSIVSILFAIYGQLYDSGDD